MVNVLSIPNWFFLNNRIISRFFTVDSMLIAGKIDVSKSGEKPIEISCLNSCANKVMIQH